MKHTNNKLFYFTFSALLLMFGAITTVADDTAPTIVKSAIQKAYVPVGFDDNDRTQIAVEGMFPNTCYRVGPHSVKVDKAAKTISVEQQAYHYNGVCLQVIVPFSQVIDIGLLEPGNYKILEAGSTKELGMLPILRSKNVGPDDYLYAPINDAYTTNDGPQKNRLVLAGAFSDRCSEFEEIKILYQERVIVVQPIVKRTQEPCNNNEKTRFLKTVDLDAKVTGAHLLHVRSLDGQAVNRMVDLQ